VIGKTIGPYQILAELGRGGMGEVYRARDTKLNREVAIKVLPDAFADDAERLARFTREAQTLAALNHPNIATIYGLEESPGSSVQGPASNGRALVMELVEGDDLSEIIRSSEAGSSDPAGPPGLKTRPPSGGGMPLAEALAIARQIIDALEAAHDIGIVHRDLKPANIKVRHDGTVKVLDFGLAKAMDSGSAGLQDPSNSPTLTARATQMGMIIGTAAYMSPEQARGRPVDKRTDVWAFGCVLYEMLTGRKAFDGEDATEIISSVVKTEPDWNALPATVPAHIRTIVTGCLIKDRKARIPDLSVVRYMLDGTVAAAPASVAAVQAAPPGSARVWQIATVVLLLAALAAGAAWYSGTSVPQPAAARFTISPPDGMAFTAGGFSGVVPAISPDGRTIAFTAQDAAGKRMLWLRPIDSLVAQQLQGTEGAAFPFWSPDSRFIAYAITGKLMKVAAVGGPPLTVCTLNPGIVSRGGSWSREDVMVFNNGPAVPLYRVSAAGGGAEAQPFGALLDGEAGRQFPSFLPDGRRFLYSGGGSEGIGVYVASLDSPEVKRVVSASTGAVYHAKSGRLLFVRQGTLLAQPFDLKTLEVSGDPVAVAEQVSSVEVPGLVAFSLSDTGVLAYGGGTSTVSGFQMTWMDRTGKAVGIVGPVARYRGLILSPSELQVAAHRHEDDGGDVWVTDLGPDAGGRTSRLTFDVRQENASPIWSTDGSRIAFSSIRAGKPGIYIKASNNSGVEELVYENSATRFLMPLSWTTDEKSILFGMVTSDTGRDLWLLSLDGEKKATPVVQTQFTESHGQLSPDGQWLAYGSDESGSTEVYVVPASGRGGKWPVSNGGGRTPRWRRDSQELYYVNAGMLMAVPVTVKDGAIVPGIPKALFEMGAIGVASAHSDYFPYAVANNGQRFLVARRPDTAREGPPSPIVVMLNWAAAIKK